MKKSIITILGIAAMLFSCDNYLDVNDNPDRAQYENIPPNLTLAAAQTQTYRAITGDSRNVTGGINSSSMNQLGNIWMVSWAGNVNSFTGAYANEYTVNLNTTFYDEIWDYTYRNVANFERIIEYKSDNFDNHKAIAMILKSYYMQYIVDLYGDCPYSEAFKGDKLLFPTYDDDKLVYQALYDNLDQAIALINSTDSNDAVVGGEDTMLAGNMTNWKKFANSIKLKLLVRQSSSTDASVQSYITSKASSLASESFIDSNVTINPGYGISNSSAQNPFYANFGYNISGSAVQNRSYVTATQFAADKLNGTASGVNDVRGRKLFTGTTVVGIIQGDNAAGAPDAPSFLGSSIIPVPVGTNSTVGSSMSGFVMTTSEIKFLLSEAALKFPAFSSYNAQQMWKDGVTASFIRLGNTAAEASSYLLAIDAVSGYGWTATSNKVEAIMYQKWIATMHIHAIESWIDYVRTGFPVTPLPLINSTGRPKTLLYPASEYSSNAAKVPNRTQAMAYSTAPFWGQ